MNPVCFQDKNILVESYDPRLALRLCVEAGANSDTATTKLQKNEHAGRTNVRRPDWDEKVCLKEEEKKRMDGLHLDQ
jgi:hypothetical protein